MWTGERLMLAGIGMNFYWPGDGAVPPAVDSSFENSIGPGFKEGGTRGGFETFMFFLLAWMGTL